MDRWHNLFPASSPKRKLCWCENTGTNQALPNVPAPPRTHTQEGQSSPHPQTVQNDINAEPEQQTERRRQEGRTVGFWGKLQSGCDLVKTNYDNWSVTVYDWAALNTFHRRKESHLQRTRCDSQQYRCDFNQMWQWPSSSGSTSCPHTHTHTDVAVCYSGSG